MDNPYLKLAFETDFGQTSQCPHLISKGASKVPKLRFSTVLKKNSGISKCPILLTNRINPTPPSLNLISYFPVVATL